MKRWMMLAAAVLVLLMVGTAAAEAPPDPTNPAHTTGNFWVNHTWDVGYSGWMLISGETWGAFYGFTLTGSAWQSDPGIASGLGDVGW